MQIIRHPKQLLKARVSLFPPTLTLATMTSRLMMPAVTWDITPVQDTLVYPSPCPPNPCPCLIFLIFAWQRSQQTITFIAHLRIPSGRFQPHVQIMPGSSTSAIALDGKQLYHRVTWPSEGVMLLEFNRSVGSVGYGCGLERSHVGSSVDPAKVTWCR